MTGMVLREVSFSTAVTWRCFSQVVVFLYLLDEKTSLLVQVPAGIAAVIEVSSCSCKRVPVYSHPQAFTSCWLVIVLAYCKPSTTEAGEGLGTWLCMYV